MAICNKFIVYMNKTIATFAVAMFVVASVPYAASASSDANTTAALSQTTITCIKDAVAARETSLGAGWTTFSTDVSKAYTARAAALATAYSNDTHQEIKTAVKTAWTTFKNSVKSARAEWKQERKEAWAEFKADKKECRAPKTIDDSSNESTDPE